MGPDRRGAGPRPAAFRIRLMVVAPTCMPSLRSSPLIRGYPHLGVSRPSVSRWYQAWRKGGARGLAGAGRAGRRPRFSEAERRSLDRALLKGPLAHGFPTDLWTLKRIAIVIERITGVRYHVGHVWKILRSMNWTLQRPARRAAERDEEAIARWVKTRWPQVKKTPGAGGRGSSSATSRESA